MDPIISSHLPSTGSKENMTSPMRSLEFERVLQEIAGRARSSSGKSAVMELEPAWESAGARQLSRETLAAAAMLQEGLENPAGRNDDLIGICTDLADGVLVLEPFQLRTAGLALQEQSSFLNEVNARCANILELDALKDLIGALPVMDDLSRHLLHLTTVEGDLSPSASSELTRLSRTVGRLKKKLSARIESIFSSLSGKNVLRDMPPTIRDGRYVLPVIASRKREVRGIVHDRSESGETVFMEPSSLVEDGNSLREAELDLEYERRRILREATLMIRNSLEELSRGTKAMEELDAIFSRASYHLEKDTVFPEEGKMSLVDLVHPLIPPNEVVGNTLSLPEDWRVLIISGPNAGGKSVLLKSVGLAVLCSQSGIGACAGAESTLPFFSDIHVSIGDQQSIADHTSTYSARLQEQLNMLRAGSGPALALIDEPSAGTDPLTGSALAASVLEHLAFSNFRIMVTTHQGQLKSLAQGREGFYNGCMNFRTETLRPDYTYVHGIPGSSFTLEIARRMDFPETVLERAAGLAGDSFRLDRVLEEVTETRRKLRDKLEEARSLRLREEAEHRRLEEELQLRLKDLREERERLRQEYISLEKEINSQADSLLSRLARSQSAQERRELRRKIREIAGRSGSAADPLEIDHIPTQGDIEVGDWVSVKDWNGTGRVLEVGRDQITVTMGDLKLRKSPDQVSRVSPPRQETSSAGWNVQVDSEMELDLRGLSGDEALLELDRALDDGVVSGIPFIRVIHGKGKGILMKAVVDMVRRDDRVKDFRPGKPSEGGTGVTMVYLTEGAGQH